MLDEAKSVEIYGSQILGLKLVHDGNIREAPLSAIRILDVFPNSPAHSAGLESFEDYLLGTEDMVFQNSESLIRQLVEEINIDPNLLQNKGFCTR